MTITFTDDERQTVLLTLAFVALDRPWLDDALRSLALKFGTHAVAIFETYKSALAPTPELPDA